MSPYINDNPCEKRKVIFWDCFYTFLGDNSKCSFRNFDGEVNVCLFCYFLCELQLFNLSGSWITHAENGDHDNTYILLGVMVRWADSCKALRRMSSIYQGQRQMFAVILLLLLLLLLYDPNMNYPLLGIYWGQVWLWFHSVRTFLRTH